MPALKIENRSAKKIILLENTHHGFQLIRLDHLSRPHFCGNVTAVVARGTKRVKVPTPGNFLEARRDFGSPE